MTSTFSSNQACRDTHPSSLPGISSAPDTNSWPMLDLPTDIFGAFYVASATDSFRGSIHHKAMSQDFQRAPANTSPIQPSISPDIFATHIHEVRSHLNDTNILLRRPTATGAVFLAHNVVAVKYMDKSCVMVNILMSLVDSILVDLTGVAILNSLLVPGMFVQEKESITADINELLVSGIAELENVLEVEL
ncbi:hypothetical protein DL95DRAFT_452845 [Leptodontidium sp. 2 PMI_412]|nr:hypothetical protein DL95DRAFT_452845 [Leptodontidium sp. 2 PMI_412]